VNSLSGVGWVMVQKEGCAVLASATGAQTQIGLQQSRSWYRWRGRPNLHLSVDVNENAGGSETQQHSGVHPEALN
jgi:hypothetical protein